MSDLIEIFKRFNDDATKAILIAQEETRRSGHDLVGPAQLLLGLSLVDRSHSREVLEKKGVKGSAIRRKLIDLLGLGEGHVPVEIPFSPEAKTIVQNASQIAAAHGREVVGTEDILISLLDNPERWTDQILGELGASRDDLRQALSEVS